MSSTTNLECKGTATDLVNMNMASSKLCFSLHQRHTRGQQNDAAVMEVIVATPHTSKTHNVVCCL